MTLQKKLINLWLLVMPSLACFYLGLFLTIRLRYPQGLDRSGWQKHLTAFSVIYALWLVVFFAHNLFDLKTLRRYTNLLFSLITAMSINTLLAVIYFYFQPELILTPRRFLLIDVLITFVIVVIWYLLVKYLLKNRFHEPLYLFSLSSELEDLEPLVAEHDFLGYQMRGHLKEDNLKETEISTQANIILPDNLSTRPEIVQYFFELRNQGISFFYYKDFYENLVRRVPIAALNELWFLENIAYKHRRFYSLVSRLRDILVGLIGFVVFIVTFPIIALIIALTSAGPIFFIQPRVGRGGRIFKLYKYRTMSGGVTNTWTAHRDPRITTVGRLLRKTRIDELPQCLNLLLGDMSLVGPRPEQANIVAELQQLIPFYNERHLVKPGLTGWAQLNVYASTVEETKRKLQYDLYYIKHRSFLFDLEIILKTIYYVFTLNGR